jgi:hypothetical protein
MDVVMIITTDHFILAATWQFSLFSVFFVFAGSKKRKEEEEKKRSSLADLV